MFGAAPQRHRGAWKRVPEASDSGNVGRRIRHVGIIGATTIALMASACTGARPVLVEVDQSIDATAAALPAVPDTPAVGPHETSAVPLPEVEDALFDWASRHGLTYVGDCFGSLNNPDFALDPETPADAAVCGTREGVLGLHLIGSGSDDTWYVVEVTQSTGFLVTDVRRAGAS